MDAISHDMYDGARVLWSNRRICSASTVCGEIRYQPGGFCGPRHQRDVQLVMVQSGACQVTIDEVVGDLPVGWAGVFLPGHREYFAFSPTHETHHTWCAVDPAQLPASLRKRLAHAPARCPCSATFNQMHAAALALPWPLGEVRTTVLDQLGLSLLWEYVAMGESWQQHRFCDGPVDRARHYMEAHLADHDCLEGALEAAGISRNALIKQFAATLGLTPARYLWQQRTERGIALLGDSGLSITDIAARCGFANPFHFSRLVRRLQGLAPTAIRQRHWAERS